MSHALPNEAPTATSTARNVDAAAVARVLGRWAAAEDIAGTAVYLASDASRYVTGAIIPVDGGLGMGH